MENGPAHVWWLVRRGGVRVVEVSGRNSAVLVMSSLAQLLVLLCGDVLLYTSHGEWEIIVVSTMAKEGISVIHWLTVTVGIYCLHTCCMFTLSFMHVHTHDHPYSTRIHSV